MLVRGGRAWVDSPVRGFRSVLGDVKAGLAEDLGWDASDYRLGPMRAVKTNRKASAVMIRGHAIIQNLRRSHYELAVDAAPLFRLATAFE